MKTQLIRVITALALCASLHQAAAQGTAFTYQGRLIDGGNPANGTYDLSFSLYNVDNGGAVAAGPVTLSATGVTNGLFTVMLDFGPVFNYYQAYWLDIAVRTNGGGAFSELSPRQPLTPTPYSIFSGLAAYATLADGVVGGTIGPNAFQVGAGPTPGQVLSYNGSLLAWTTVGAGGGGSGWSLTGNSNTIAGTDFLGTTDNQPLELWVNSTRAFRLEPGVGGSPNVVGGSSSSADGTVNGGTIAGGIGNTVSHIYPTVSGGQLNHATANGAVVGGGYNNTANGGQATVAGGVQNTASGIGAFIGGGGYDGTTQSGNNAGGAAATVGGGLANTASSAYDTVPGGSYNIASGGNSFAAGHQAQALHNGAFVWADATGGAFQSTAPDQFSVRAEGGVRFVTGGAGLTIDGVLVTNGGGGGGSGWSLTGNNGTDPSVDFVGTKDNAALELRVANAQALLLVPNGGGADVIGGSFNSIAPGSAGNIIAGGYGNYIGSTYATISGGVYNTNTGEYATVGGGWLNTAGYLATVSGGWANTASGNYATVGGGYGNTAGAYYATVLGGFGNSATGQGSFAAGQNASTVYKGSFIWGDGSRAATGGGTNHFDVLATGGVNFFVGGGTPTLSAVPISGSTLVGINTSTPRQPLDVNGGFLEVQGAGAQAAFGGLGTTAVDIGSFNPAVSTVSFVNLSSFAPMSIQCCSIAIQGGCDLAEPFQISASHQEIPEGSVVVIDEENPGHLKLSEQPYDARVAGIVSGANGINPGIQMHQEGVLEGGKNVALSGRVYVQADVSNGPIKPGDLLTSSTIHGHAMRVSDHSRAQGAILGKAMTGLKDGNGMVLVLVSLQ